MSVPLATDFGPLKLKSPILTASGCFAYGQQFGQFMDLTKLGGLSTKGISPLPRRGNGKGEGVQRCMAPCRNVCHACVRAGAS